MEESGLGNLKSVGDVTAIRGRRAPKVINNPSSHTEFAMCRISS
jgi:hypothetical protein